MSSEQQRNEAISATAVNKEHIEKTNVDIKYQFKSPYVNDKETLNGALKFDASNEKRLRQGQPAQAMKSLAGTNIKFIGPKPNEREGFIY